jgi:hypothetical protein
MKKGIAAGASSSKSGVKVRITNLEFSDSTVISFRPDTIPVLTGPNNVGKSACLREIRDRLTESAPVGPVLKRIEIERTGSIEEFREVISRSRVREASQDAVRIGNKKYYWRTFNDDFEQMFVGTAAMDVFVSHLGAGERLALTEPVGRPDYAYSGPSQPIQWLELDEDAEAKVSSIFERPFGMRLHLNTLAGQKMHLHVSSVPEPEQHTTKTREYAHWAIIAAPLGTDKATACAALQARY